LNKDDFNDAFSKEDFEFLQSLLMRYVREKLFPKYQSDVEDLVSEAMIRLVGKMRQMSDQGIAIASIEAFARRFATRTCQDFFRKVNRQKYVEAQQLPEPETKHNATTGRIDDADFLQHILVANFSGTNLAIARMMPVAGPREIAEITELSLPTIYRRIERIKERFAEIRNEICEETGKVKEGQHGT